MVKKSLIVYSDGSIIEESGSVSMSYHVSHGISVTKTIDITKATSTEISQLKADPANQALIDTITKR